MTVSPTGDWQLLPACKHNEGYWVKVQGDKLSFATPVGIGIQWGGCMSPFEKPPTVSVGSPTVSLLCLWTDQ